MNIHVSKRRRRVAALLVLLVGLAAALAAQEIESFAGNPVRITTNGHETYQGTLYAVLDDRVEIVLANGQIIQLLRSEIDTVVAIDPDAGRRALFQDAATNRLMVMPTGFPMAQGEFHVSDQEIIVVTGSYGVTDWFSVWGGISVPGFLLSGRFSAHLSPSIGASVGTFVGVEWIGGSALLLPYALLSFGEPNRNFTAGGAAVFSTNGSGFAGAVAAFGGKFAVTPTTAIVSENWLIWTTDSGAYYPSFNVLGLSFRIAGSRLSWDIGAVVPLLIGESYDTPGRVVIRGLAGDAIIPLPLISLTYRID